MLLGIGYGQSIDIPPGRAASLTVSQMWQVTEATVGGIVKIFYNPQARKEVSGVVGSFEVTRQTIAFDETRALFILALISLSLAVVNLFPFLPLDGGHIFWALARRSGPPDPVRGHGARERRRLPARRDPVRRRPHERHRAIDGQRLQRALSPRAG